MTLCIATRTPSLLGAELKGRRGKQSQDQHLSHTRLFTNIDTNANTTHISSLATEDQSVSYTTPPQQTPYLL